MGGIPPEQVREPADKERAIEARSWRGRPPEIQNLNPTRENLRGAPWMGSCFTPI
jgi:hypothetical protein